MSGMWGSSKKGVRYRTALTPDVRCDHCKYMFPRVGVGGCRLVRGVIRTSATCDEFSPRRSPDAGPADTGSPE
jgi:hypothetical protein